MKINKITTGFVIQTYDGKTGRCVGQEFVAGDEVKYEDQNGESVDWSEKADAYQPFDMVQPGCKAHVLTYSHRHGETVSVYSTEEKAQKAAAMTVADYIDEIHRPEDRRQIAKALNAQDYDKALELWGEYQSNFDGGEAIDITPCKLDEDVDDKPIKVSLKGKSK